MKTSIATVSISGTLREKLPAIAAAGFDGIEIFEQDFITSDLSPREVGQMVRDHGLIISLFQPFRDFETLPEPLRSRALARAERKFDLMAELGAPLMLVCSSVHPAALGGIDRAADDLRALGDLAASRGLRLGYEALAWGRHVSDHRDAWEIVRRADHPAVGLILDSFHTLGRGIETDSIRSIPGDRIFFVQLADAPAIPMDLLYWSRHFRNMPGEGDLDVTRFLRSVLATGYDGTLSLEIFNDQFRQGLPMGVARDGYRSLVAALDAVRRAEPTLAVDLPAFPPPAAADGVEFVEFATAPDEAAALAAALAQAGFTRAGHHVSKPVDLWRQGGINILVNTSAEGFAHAAYLSHGTTVAEIAIRVPDAAACFTRARALGAQVHEAAVEATELTIPAIRGVGGSMLRLLDAGENLGRIWDIDFDAGPGAFAGAGLTRIDHIAQTMGPDEILSWSLFYGTLLDAAPAPLVDVADPDGLVKSRAIRSGGLRVTLNGTSAHRTLAGRFHQDSFGAAVQHLAFATDDIFASAARLADLGFDALPMGDNYYDDLLARHGLDPTFAARLKAAHVLYDRDEAGGEFFQLYGNARPDGLFFEVCERRGGYDGYGAPNAPFRIAAQKRRLRPYGMPAR
ncbi:bifunctional sugar phosphate isomerase/epimerase/4-hydroxyphenylpyruvate dioxygenase family protein [Paracoccus contaminans]|uniref:3-dehydroshikimate dehydratase n=1 Tax=Paracoccus contaminans TaxID=1945662 RepID=A0A1W6D141_9RHOB|nr:sugar phosphate isomerase/epimerase and 4-hydroxyphenylpyruvate domain-containing protein [Paracoccus contaminans]ARJ70834.1 3-keto-5-aminohexanoate cleavage protein [Paracoccus contaminans]